MEEDKQDALENRAMSLSHAKTCPLYHTNVIPTNLKNCLSEAEKGMRIRQDNSFTKSAIIDKRAQWTRARCTY